MRFTLFLIAALTVTGCGSAPDTAERFAALTQALDGGLPQAWIDLCSQYNLGAACNATDVALLTKSTACWQCAADYGIIDSVLGGTSGANCEDLAGNASAGAKAGQSKSSLCLSALSCGLTSGCLPNWNTGACLCANTPLTTCEFQAFSTIAGPCKQQIADGLELPTTGIGAVQNMVLDELDMSKGAGVANNLLMYLPNNCPACN